MRYTPMCFSAGGGHNTNRLKGADSVDFALVNLLEPEM